MYKKITFKTLVFWSFIIATILRFQISEAQPCMGIPVPGNTLSTTTTPCPYTPFTLSIQNIASLGTGIAFQWSESYFGIAGPYTPIGGATLASTYTTSLPPSTSKFYRCTVTCISSGGIQYSYPINVTSSWTGCYCISAATGTQDEDIYSVTINGNSTNPLYAYSNGCTTIAPGSGSILNMFSSFLSLPPLTTLSPSSIASFSIDQNECDGPAYYGNQIGIWIDFNQNFDFTDAGEQVYLETVNTIGPRIISGNFAIPSGVMPGTTAMRVVCREGATPSPCGTYPVGETEDYLVNIGFPTSPCTGTPNPGNTIASGVSVCSGGICNLSLQNSISSASIGYQWYNTLGIIVGATNSTYNTVITSSESFYCMVTCNTSGLSNTSTPVNVQVIPTIVVSLVDSACYSYWWLGYLLTTSGTYSNTFTAISGCDSIHILNLTILQSSSNAFTLSGCDTVTFNGISYTNSGIYIQNYMNAVGCDSVVTVNVTVNQTTDSMLVQTGCDFYTFNSTVYSTSGIYTHTFMSASGCDSTIHLDLTMSQSTDSVINSLSCNAFTLNGLTYTNTGNYTQSLLNASGCDSTILLQLTIDTLQAIITASGTGLSTPSGGSFQWFDCSTNTIIPGATSLNFIPTSGGSYAVIVTTSTCVDTSICVNVWATNTEDLNSDKDITIYPNPSQGIFELGLNNPAEMILVSSIGEIILQEKFLKGKHSLNISSYASGVYFLKVKSNEKLVTYKLIKE